MSLREQFENEVKVKYSGIELLFETSGQKYIEWLELKVNQGQSLPIDSVTHQRELFDNFYKWYDSLTVAESDEHSLTSAIETYFFKIIK